MRHIRDNKEYIKDAKKRHIDESQWIKYIAKTRRNISLTPLTHFDNNTTLFLDYVAQLDKIKLHQSFNDIIDKYYDENNNFIAYTDELRDADVICDKTVFNDVMQSIYGVMIKKAEVDLYDFRIAYKTLYSFSDLRIPHEWYPASRIMKRKIIYHGGPTNSGKTYHALQRLKEADPDKGGGIYCGPLRLLALEVFENLNRSGVYTNLVTGQEIQEVPFATHTSSTVEMVSTTKEYDVAVIDEIQMIGNQQRGDAWTRVLLGLRAREIHVCGGLEALDIVKYLAENMGDDFVLNRYERLSTLQIYEESLRGDYSKIRPGDCVVAFTRQDIFSIKHQIEKLTPYKCAVIYGQLPPDIRSMQARLFNEENTGYDVLVASDAIGMGLNLNIRRIIFHTILKNSYDSTSTSGISWVDPSTVKQIAGRAGRLSSNYKIGEVTAWQDSDLSYVRAVMKWDIPQIKSAGLRPTVAQIELFSNHLTKVNAQRLEDESRMINGIDADSTTATDTTTDTATDTNDSVSNSSTVTHPAVVATITSESGDSNDRVVITATQVDSAKIASLGFLIERFIEISQMDGKYFLCDSESLITISNWLHTIPLSLVDRFTFANAPASARDHLVMPLLYGFATAYAMKKPVALNVRLPTSKPRDFIELADLCAKHNAIDLYLWLSLRFPKYFVERDVALLVKDHAVNLIQSCLDSSTLSQEYSHSAKYIKMRNDLLKRSDGSPPHEYGKEIRTSTREILKTLHNDNLLVFPHKDKEGGGGSGGDAMRKDKSKGRSSNYSSGSNSGNSGSKARDTRKHVINQLINMD